jgi:hypothetical protein
MLSRFVLQDAHIGEHGVGLVIELVEEDGEVISGGERGWNNRLEVWAL